MVRTGKTEPVSLRLDADVLIAGPLSRRGASHVVLVLSEIGLLDVVLPEAAIEEVRRNLSVKLPDAVPFFEGFLRAVAVRIYHPTGRDRARELADPKTFQSSLPLFALEHASSSRTTPGTTGQTREFESFDRGRSSRSAGLACLLRRIVAACARVEDQLLLCPPR